MRGNRYTYNQQWQKQQLTNLPAIGSVGLFTPKLDPIPGSFGTSGEKVNDAINRLRSKLKSLQLARVVTPTSTADLPQLNVAVSMQVVGKKDEIIANSLGSLSLREQDTQPNKLVRVPSPNPYKIQQGERIQLRIANNGSRVVYITVLAIDPTEKMMVLFPNQLQSSRNATELQANQTLLIPNPDKDRFQLGTKKKGVSEILIIASSTPLQRVRLGLENQASQARQPNKPVIPNDDEIEVVGDFVDTFNEGTGGTRGGLPLRRGRVVPLVDTTTSIQSVVMSITVEVVDKPDS